MYVYIYMYLCIYCVYMCNNTIHEITGGRRVTMRARPRAPSGGCVATWRRQVGGRGDRVTNRF